MRTLYPVLALLVLLLTSGCTRTRYVTTSGGSTSLDVVNRTSVPVYYLYVSSCSSDSWGPDRLGSDVVMPNARQSFTMDAGCWDLKARFRDGDEVTRRNVRLRSGTSWTWTLSN